MARGPNERSGPQVSQPGSRRNAEALTKGHLAGGVTDEGDEKHATLRRRSLPVAFGSQAEPCAGRTMWHVMYRCGTCNETHFGRSREALTTGKKLARCGRVVWPVIARNYSAPGPGESA
jgi:hypothetical protein